MYQYLSPILILIVSYGLILTIFTRRKSNCLNLPRGKKSWPFIGDTLEFYLGRNEPEKFINQRTEKYSQDVFKMSLLGKNIAVFCGDSGNEFLLSNANNKHLKVWLPETIQKDFGITLADVVKLKTTLPEFLKTESLKHYVPIMDSMAKDHFQEYWFKNRVVTAHPLIKKYTLSVACRLFMNLVGAEEVSRIEVPFVALVDGMLSLPINFPGFSYRRAIRAATAIHENLIAFAKKRKLELSECGTRKESDVTDLLSRILMAKDEVGNPKFNEGEISSMVVALLLASHDTVTSAITLVLKHLAENPEVYKKVYKEQTEIANSKDDGEVLNWDDLQKMTYSWCVACESMRLSPPSSGNYRTILADLTYAGFTIPRGWKAYWTAYSTHKNPKYFKDPENFDPSRFEGDGPLPYTFVPFGKGPHMCPGKEYARLGMLVFMHNLVTKFKWQNLIPDEKTAYTGAIFPVHGLPIKLEPHSHNK